MDAAMLASVLLTRLDGPDLSGSFSRGSCHAAQHRGREGLMVAHCSMYIEISFPEQLCAASRSGHRHDPMWPCAGKHCGCKAFGVGRDCPRSIVQKQTYFDNHGSVTGPLWL